MLQFWASVLKPMLDKTKARVVIEIGADEGRNSIQLARWSRENRAMVHVVDPEPRFDMERLEERFAASVRVHRVTSLEALPDLLPADAVLIDGDHNWYTVYHELEALFGPEGTEPPASAPIAVCHDVEWPYGRRDLYYAPERIPETYRQPCSRGGLHPPGPGVTAGGLNFAMCHAEREGGARNGVKTAIEDALAGRESAFRVAWIPVLFGLAIIVPMARLVARPDLTAFLDSLEPSRSLRSICKTTERDRVLGTIALSALHAIDGSPTETAGDRSFDSCQSGDLLKGLMRGTMGSSYKGRAMLLNPLDMANYLDLMARLKPAAVIEIGTHEGGRALWLADTMQALGLAPSVLALDLNPPQGLDDPRIRVRSADALNLGAVLTEADLEMLGHPLLVIEDSAHDEETTGAVLDFFGPYLSTGDYIVVEDGLFQDPSDLRASGSDLAPPARATAAFLARRGEDYEIDTRICDRFGYNATFNPNGWLRRK